MSLIGNERAKLTATYVNGVALIVFGVGAFAPAVSFLYGSAPSVPAWAAAIVSSVCLGLSLSLHVVARRLLGALL